MLLPPLCHAKSPFVFPLFHIFLGKMIKILLYTISHFFSFYIFSSIPHLNFGLELDFFYCDNAKHTTSVEMEY